MTDAQNTGTQNSEKSITFLELVNETTSLIKEHYCKFNSIIRNIDAIFLELNGDGNTGKTFHEYSAVELADFGGTLAVLRASLIQYKEEAFVQTKISKVNIEVIEASVRPKVKQVFKETDTKATVSDINTEVEKRLARVKLIHDLHCSEYEKIQSYWYSIPDVLHRIEQKIQIAKGDYSTAKFYGDNSNLTDFA